MILSVGALKYLTVKRLQRSKFYFSSYIQALGFVFHKTVEMAVDNFVDNLRKCVIVTILHQIAQGLCN